MPDQHSVAMSAIVLRLLALLRPAQNPEVREFVSFAPLGTWRSPPGQQLEPSITCPNPAARNVNAQVSCFPPGPSLPQLRMSSMASSEIAGLRSLLHRL
tara:strand:- start:314 stop:610 length:297 start_codon:yes stop_codon:yes gene_type:complete